MSTIETGGSAFPGIKIVSGDNYNPPKQYHTPGMTLRDYFAAKAMQASIEVFLADPPAGAKELTRAQAFLVIAETAYKQADAMIDERSKNV